MRSEAQKSTRLLAVFATALLVVTQVSQVVHFVLVRHTVCPIHGKTVELHEGKHPALGSLHSRDRWISPDDRRDEDHGKACEVVSTTQSTSLQTIRSVASVSLPLHRIAAVRCHEATYRPRPLLLFAPKTSPPTA